MDLEKATRGAEIVTEKWLNLDSRDVLLIVTDDSHADEAQLLKQFARKKGCRTDIMITRQSGKMVGIYFDETPDAFDDYTIIIGATDYSLVTTRAAKNAIRQGKKFLSLPLHTNDGRSMLEYDFLLCDTEQSKMLAQKLTDILHTAKEIHVTTPIGSDMYFYKKDRHCKFFNGNVDDCDGYSSASIEVYVPIEETKTHGVLFPDGSYGYAGKIECPFRVIFENGRITEIEDSPFGNILKEFIDDYNAEKMYIASEFGIGLNSLSRCKGNCYIEDESSLGTFHIGFGRNLALGGNMEASGHFDLTMFSPDIYADNIKIMEKGKIII